MKKYIVFVIALLASLTVSAQSITVKSFRALPTDMTVLSKEGKRIDQNNLGWMNYKGYDVNQDYSEAMKWYRKAADQGNAIAQNNLGYMYDEGLGVTKDYAEAVKWYRKAADQGDEDAKNKLKEL